MATDYLKKYLGAAPRKNPIGHKTFWVKHAGKTKKVVHSNFFDAAKKFVSTSKALTGYELIPGGKPQGTGVRSFELINHSLQMGDVVWVFDHDPAYKTNPAPRIGTAKPKRPSQATGKAPSKRLVSRRKNNTVKGTFPNPAKKTRSKDRAFWIVKSVPAGKFEYSYLMSKNTLENVKKSALALTEKYKCQATIGELWL